MQHELGVSFLPVSISKGKRVGQENFFYSCGKQWVSDMIAASQHLMPPSMEPSPTSSENPRTPEIRPKSVSFSHYRYSGNERRKMHQEHMNETMNLPTITFALFQLRVIIPSKRMAKLGTNFGKIDSGSEMVEQLDSFHSWKSPG